jgi:hypothetical protein
MCLLRAPDNTEELTGWKKSPFFSPSQPALDGVMARRELGTDCEGLGFKSGVDKNGVLRYLWLDEETDAFRDKVAELEVGTLTPTLSPCDISKEERAQSKSEFDSAACS